MSQLDYDGDGQMFKEIMENRYEFWYRFKHSTETLALIIWALRMLLAIISFNNDPHFKPFTNFINHPGSDWTYWNMDPFCYYRYHSNPKFFFHSIMFILIITMMGILGKITFFFCPIDSPTFSWPYRYLILNCEQYEQCCLPKPEISLRKQILFEHNYRQTSDKYPNAPMMVRKLIALFTTQFTLIKNKDVVQLDIGKWSKIGRIDIGQTVTLEERIRIVRYFFMVEPIIFVLHGFLISMSIFIIIDYNTTFHLILIDDKSAIRLIIIIDSIVFIHNMIIICQLIIFFAVLANACTVLNYDLMTKINSMIKNVSELCKRMMGNQKIYKWTNNKQQLMMTIHREHTEICMDYMNSYGELWSISLLINLLISVPFDVIAISAYWSDQLLWIDLMSVNVILVMHASATIFTFIDLARQTKVMHEAGKYLEPIINSIHIYSKNRHESCSNDHLYRHATLCSRTLLFKYKLVNLYERLHNEPKYGPRIAILGSITNRFIFELILTYIGAFLFVLPRI